MSKKYGLAVFIGRFQPFHNGHLYAINRALEEADKVLILVGDTGGPPTVKNPWSFGERSHMIQLSLNDAQAERVIIEPIYDHPSDTEWVANVQATVSLTLTTGNESIILVGHNKDDSSFYLKLFPQWRFLDTGFERMSHGIEGRYDASAIRQLFFEDKFQYVSGILPKAVFEFICQHKTRNIDLYEELRTEYKFLQEYRKSWASSPFPPVFVTTDCVVVQSGHILLIQRGQAPGKGLWALPGGFIDQIETIEECALRELIEETSIKLQPEVLRRCIKNVTVFDRAGGVGVENRGRIITHAHLIKLDDDKPLPKVKGADDAAAAAWVPIGEIDFRTIFSDHGHIIQAMLAKI